MGKEKFRLESSGKLNQFWQCDISSKDDDEVAVVFGDNKEQCEVRAKQMVAAPELLEVCETLIKLKDVILPPKPVRGVSREYKKGYAALSNLIEMANSTIKKAK